MNGDRWNSEFLLREQRSHAEHVDDRRRFRPCRGADLVLSPENRGQRSKGMRERLARLPQIRITDAGLIVLFGAERFESKTVAADQRFEVGIRRERDVVSAATEFQGEPEEWEDVTRTADGEDDKVHVWALQGDF